jgi:trk system potassium uptake protein
MKPQIFHLSNLPGVVRHRRIPIALRLVLGLLVLVVAGTFVLWLLPGVTVQRISFMQALFTATSAVTVTGLTVVTTSTEFTRFGQFVLLLLIQIGGVGYMFAAVIIMRLLGRQVSLLDRLALSSSLGLAGPRGILHLLGKIVIGIVVVEGVGALALYIHWQRSGIVAPADAAFYAIFHAVAAFANAGFDLFAGLPQYPRGVPGDGLSLIIMGILVVVGGLGIPVFLDLALWRTRRRLSLHSRITLVVSVVLILVGWLGLLLSESGEGVLRNTPPSTRLVHTWFQSVSTRTAGFPGLEDFNNLGDASQLLVMSLMFVGSAPASMGGGITTGTLAVLSLAMWGYVNGRPVTRAGRRTISAGTVQRALAILTISLFVVMLAAWLILLTHQTELGPVIFEVISAFATCGLSLGLTASLNVFGQLIIILMMFWGRLGALTIFIALLQRKGAKQLVHYPEETILIG